jgi:hypothetical protein
MRKMEMRRMIARHTIMKIHFELNTMRSGINKISRWNIIVSNPVNKFSSYFVYNNTGEYTWVLTKKANIERLKKTVRVIAAAMRTFVGDWKMQMPAKI